MKTLKQKFTLSGLLTLLLACLGSAALFLTMTFAYDKVSARPNVNAGYFDTESVLPLLFVVFAALAVVFAIVCLFLFRKTDCPAALLPKMQYAPLALRLLSPLLILLAPAAYLSDPSASTLLLGAVTALFFLSWLVSSFTGKAIHLLSGYLAIFYCFIILAKTYFDLYTPMNSPLKILLHLSLISVMLFLLADFRLLLDRAIPAFFVSTSVISIFFLSATSLTGIYFALFTDRLTDAYLGYHLVLLAFLVYIILRTVTFYRAASEEAPDAELPTEDIPEEAPTTPDEIPPVTEATTDSEPTAKTDL